MTATQVGFLDAIRAEPDCDDHRLIFADWLQDHGDEARAEFIRVQCRIARLDMGGRQLPMGVGREALSKREDELVRFNATRWIWAELPEELLEGFGTWNRKGVARIISRRSLLYELEFRRGFIEAVLLPLGHVWLKYGPTLVSSLPIREVEVNRSPAKGEFSREHHSTLLAGKPFWRWDCELWQPEPEPLPPFVIPHEIYTYLDDYVSPEVFSNYRQYLSEQDARDSLSRACLKWAKDEAKRLSGRATS